MWLLSSMYEFMLIQSKQFPEIFLTHFARIGLFTIMNFFMPLKIAFLAKLFKTVLTRIYQLTLALNLEGQIWLGNGSRCLLAWKIVVKIMSKLRDIEIETWAYWSVCNFKIILLKRLKQLLSKMIWPFPKNGQTKVIELGSSM